MTALRYALVLSLAGLISVPASADQDHQPVNQNLAPMAFLAGACWRGDFPGQQATDTHCFSWIYDGQHLRDTHVVEGKGDPYRGETIYSWDAENQRIAFRYWNSIGGYSDGHFEIQDGILTAPERYTGKDGQIIEMRSTLEQLAPDRYVAKTASLKDGEWREDWTVNFVRTDDTMVIDEVCGMAPRE